MNGEAGDKRETAALGGEVTLTLLDGRTGKALSFRDEVLSLICPCAFAPGQPVALLLSVEPARVSQPALADTEPHLGIVRVEGKAVGSKRRTDETFDVRVRLHSLRREQRAWLVAALG